MSFDIYDMRVDRDRLIRVRDAFLCAIDYRPLQNDYSYELLSLINMLDDLELDILDLERLDSVGYFDDIDEIEEDDDTVKVADNSETADTSMSEAIMKKTAKDERVRMRRGRDSGKNTIFDNWDDEGEDEDGL